MDEIDLYGMFDSEDTAGQVSRALNGWFNWIMEGDPEDVPELFEDFGVTTEDYALEKDSDTDWEETPRAIARGNRVHILAETSETLDTLSELLEALGAYEVAEADEETAVDPDEDEDSPPRGGGDEEESDED